MLYPRSLEKAISQEEYMKTCWTICCLLFTLFVSAQTIDMSIPPDSLGQNQTKTEEWNIQTLMDPLYQFKAVLPNFAFFELKYQVGQEYYQTWMNSDLYQVSKELYENYYAKDILIWSYRKSVFISINFKDMQNNQGFLQFRIPISNFSRVFTRSQTLMNIDLEDYQWRYSK